jgi:hypothetical protein
VGRALRGRPIEASNRIGQVCANGRSDEPLRLPIPIEFDSKIASQPLADSENSFIPNVKKSDWTLFLTRLSLHESPPRAFCGGLSPTFKCREGRMTQPKTQSPV